MSTPQLSLDGELIKMKGMKIQVTMQFADEDMSGQTSGTNSTEKGDKGCELNVSGFVTYKAADDLARLFELAREKNGSSRKVYRIGSSLALAVKVTQGKFAGNVTATEQENMMAWAVQFTIREVKSVSEKIEQRAGKPAATATQTSKDSVASTTETAPTSEAPENVTLTKFEQLLAKADAALGG
jgi:hypothetical protein